jgi:hypothetical protein
MNFGNIKKNLLLLLTLSYCGNYLLSDNEVYINQVGATLNLDVEQLGSSNIIGGLDAVSGTMTAFDLNGSTMTVDINQIGSSNQFLGDIFSDDFTGFFEFTGDSNIFNIEVDPTNTYGADDGNFNIQVTGSSNEFDLDVAKNDLASGLDLDWIIQGSNNEFDFEIDYDLGTNFVDVDGSDNTVNFNADGYAEGFFYLDQTGNGRTFNITQSSTLASDWLKIISDGNSGTVCVIQNDGGTSTSC